jgi:F-type H+-transporting ATPase subunit c
VRRSLIFALMVVGVVLLSTGGVGAAEPAKEGGTNSWIGPFAVIAAGLGMALASGLCALGQGRAVASSVDAMARQPGAAGRIQTAMIIGLALIESLALYVFVIAAILLFVQPVKSRSAGGARVRAPRG